MFRNINLIDGLFYVKFETVSICGALKRIAPLFRLQGIELEQF